MMYDVRYMYHTVTVKMISYCWGKWTVRAPHTTARYGAAPYLQKNVSNNK